MRGIHTKLARNLQQIGACELGYMLQQLSAHSKRFDACL